MTLVAAWLLDLASLGWGAEDLVRNTDRLDRLRADAGPAPAQLREAVDLVEDTRLRFQLNVGACSKATAQLQGVWTPPALRRRGYASGALSAIAQKLLETNPTLSLYVNDFNRDAITLYERIGFTCVGEMSTLLFA